MTVKEIHQNNDTTTQRNAPQAKAEQSSLQKEPLTWGPLMLLAAFAIASPTPDLVFVALSGMYLCAKWQLRGACYALALLLVGAAGSHLLHVEDHLFQLGLELSFACSFLITALTFEEERAVSDSLDLQAKTSKSALQTVEEDLQQVQKAFQADKIFAQEKIETLHGTLEELKAEHSSNLILNEVLRKTSAKQLTECSELKLRNSAFEKRAFDAEAECVELQKKLDRLSYSDVAHVDNARLLEELNSARMQAEQQRLLCEAVTKRHALEVIKAKEAKEEADELSARLSELERKSIYSADPDEVKRLRDELKQQSHHLYEQIESLESQLALRVEESRYKAVCEQLEQAQEMRVALQNTLEETRQELLSKIDPADLEQLAKELEQEKLHLQKERFVSSQQIQELQEKLEVEQKEWLKEKAALEESVSRSSQEIEQLQLRLQEALESGAMSASMEKRALSALEEVERLKMQLVEAEEKAQFEERYFEAVKEVAHLNKVLEETRFVIERLSLQKEQSSKSLESEAKYQQLRKQFDEKNAVLHQVRSELFKMETEVQKIRMEKQAVLLEFVPRDVEKELYRLGHQVAALEEENRVMQELVSSLSDVKKK